MAFFKYNTITTGLKISKKLQAKMCIGKINHLFTVRNNKKKNIAYSKTLFYTYYYVYIKKMQETYILINMGL